MKRTELRQDMDEGLIDHVRLLLQYILTFVSQLRHYIPRLEFTRITQKIRDEVGRVRSELAEKFVVVFGKLTGLKRRIQNLERSREGAEGKNCTVECGNLCRHNMRLEREMSDTMSIINHLRAKWARSNRHASCPKHRPHYCHGVSKSPACTTDDP